MTVLKFTRYTDSTTLAHDSQAALSAHRSVFISSDMKQDRVDLRVADDGLSSYIRFTTNQARAIAAELIAGADARDAAQSPKPGLEG